MIGFVGCEKWFSEQIQSGCFKQSNQSSKAKYREWISNQLKSFIGILCHKSRDPELSDLIFPILIRFYLTEIEMKTKVIGRVLKQNIKYPAIRVNSQKNTD